MDSLLVQMNSILSDYYDTVSKTAEAEISETAKETADKLKETSPKGPRGYAKSWKVKKIDHTYYVCNEKHYRLTHLLENGHVVRNKYGTYGRANPIKHIKPAEEWAQEEVVKRIEAAL